MITQNLLIYDQNLPPYLEFQITSWFIFKLHNCVNYCVLKIMKSQSLTLCFTIWIKWTCVNIFAVTGYGKYMVFFQECNFGCNLCFFFLLSVKLRKILCCSLHWTHSIFSRYQFEKKSWELYWLNYKHTILICKI